MIKREKNVLQEKHTTCMETLAGKGKETESLLMDIIKAQNQSKIFGEQLLEKVLEIKEDTSTNFSEVYQLLKDLNASSQIAFNQINQTKSEDNKCHSFGKFNFRISSNSCVLSFEKIIFNTHHKLVCDTQVKWMNVDKISIKLNVCLGNILQITINSFLFHLELTLRITIWLIAFRVVVSIFCLIPFFLIKMFANWWLLN